MSEAVTSASRPRLTLPAVAAMAFALGVVHASVAALLLMLVVPGSAVGRALVTIGAVLLGTAVIRLAERLSGRKRDPFILAFFAMGLLKAGVAFIVWYALSYG